MALMIWHEGTGTVINADQCVVVDVPENVEDAEEWIENNKPEPFATFTKIEIKF